MGGTQSVRASHFHRPAEERDPQPPPAEDDFDDDNHISISNKMVERLVDDATIRSGAVAAAETTTNELARMDYTDKIYMERLKCLDDIHSERYGLTLNDARAIATRIELRTANFVSPEDVCGDIKNRILECYTESGYGDRDYAKCWELVGAFSKCVHETAAVRLRKRSDKEAKETARRERHVALAREHVLKDIEITRQTS